MVAVQSIFANVNMPFNESTKKCNLNIALYGAKLAQVTIHCAALMVLLLLTGCITTALQGEDGIKLSCCKLAPSADKRIAQSAMESHTATYSHH